MRCGTRASDTRTSTGRGSTAQLGLFVVRARAGARRAARQPVARRPPDPAADRPAGGTMRRPVRAAQRGGRGGAEVRRTRGRSSVEPSRRTGASDAIAWNADDFPDLSPIARGCSPGWSSSSRSASAGSLATAWETVLLWQNREPFSTTASVTDPIFGRDISFFLFELPFLRLIQALFNGLVVTALFLASARTSSGRCAGRRCSRPRSACTWRSSAGSSCSPSRSATSSTSSSWSYSTRQRRDERHRHHRRQLHRPERPVPRLRRADRAVRAGGGVPRRRRHSPAWSGRSG